MAAAILTLAECSASAAEAGMAAGAKRETESLSMDESVMDSGKEKKMTAEQEDMMISGEDLHTIYLAGGCFWGIEAYVKKLPGVSSTDVGYANGNTENPSYKEVCYNNTGHAETVKVVYDTSRISTDQLLDGFFKVVDPTSVNRQGNDRGSQYRTGIYYVDEADQAIAKAAVARQEEKYSSPSPQRYCR